MRKRHPKVEALSERMARHRVPGWNDLSREERVEANNKAWIALSDSEKAQELQLPTPEWDKRWGKMALEDFSPAPPGRFRVTYQTRSDGTYFNQRFFVDELEVTEPEYAKEMLAANREARKRMILSEQMPNEDCEVISIASFNSRWITKNADQRMRMLEEIQAGKLTIAVWSEMVDPEIVKEMVIEA